MFLFLIGWEQTFVCFLVVTWSNLSRRSNKNALRKGKLLMDFASRLKLFIFICLVKFHRVPETSTVKSDTNNLLFTQLPMWNTTVNLLRACTSLRPHSKIFALVEARKIKTPNIYILLARRSFRFKLDFTCACSNKDCRFIHFYFYRIFPVFLDIDTRVSSSSTFGEQRTYIEWIQTLLRNVDVLNNVKEFEW